MVGEFRFNSHDGSSESVICRRADIVTSRTAQAHLAESYPGWFTKVRLYQVCVLPVLMYWSEAWRIEGCC